MFNPSPSGSSLVLELPTPSRAPPYPLASAGLAESHPGRAVTRRVCLGLRRQMEDGLQSGEKGPGLCVCGSRALVRLRWMAQSLEDILMRAVIAGQC